MSTRFVCLAGGVAACGCRACPRLDGTPPTDPTPPIGAMLRAEEAS